MRNDRKVENSKIKSDQTVGNFELAEKFLHRGMKMLSPQFL